MKRKSEEADEPARAECLRTNIRLYSGDMCVKCTKSEEGKEHRAVIEATKVQQQTKLWSSTTQRWPLPEALKDLLHTSFRRNVHHSIDTS